jgi:hypothetical protein
MYNGLQEYVKNAAHFYREKCDPGTAETLLNEIEILEGL